jgi:hypothetical protein
MYGTITDTIDVIKIEKKEKRLNTEWYHIHKIINDRLHMIDTYIDTYNPTSETLHQITAHIPQSPI